MHAADRAALVVSIRTLFEEYLENPLYYLREAGLQARLLHLIHQRLEADGLHETAAAVIEQRDAMQFVRPNTPGRMARAQLEVRIQPGKQRDEGADVVSAQKTKVAPKCAEKSDIVVLRRAKASEKAVSLTNYPNGPLDIVRLIAVDDVDAVIELKATVSADVHMRHLFRCDVLKLLDLKARCRPDLSAHFVLVDKSLGVMGHGHAVDQPRGRPMPWWDDSFNETDNKKRWEWQSTNREIKVVRVDDDATADTAGVHVWQLGLAAEDQPDAQLQCRHFLATRR